MQIWKTPLLFCAVVVTVTSAIMMDEISSDSTVSDADNNTHLNMRSLVQKYLKILQEEIKTGISTASSACKKEVILKLFEAQQDLLRAFEAAVKDIRYECTAPPPSVEHAFAVVTNVSGTQQVATYTCDRGYTYGGGKKEVWCDRDHGRWGFATLQCIECFIRASGYKGKKSITYGGIECQRWDSQSPHKHTYKSLDFIEKNISLAENYCRKLGLSEPWCYTTDPNLEWDYCGIPECDYLFENDCGLPQPLTNAKPHYSYTNNGARASYACLKFSASTQNSYCPVRRCMVTGWTAVSISCGEHDCFRNSQEYIGKRNCTVSGRICQKWTSMFPHDHRNIGRKFPDGSAAEAGNYCRDPDMSGKLWCYTTDDAVRYEWCDVPSCDLFP